MLERQTSTPRVEGICKVNRKGVSVRGRSNNREK